VSSSSDFSPASEAALSHSGVVISPMDRAKLASQNGVALDADVHLTCY
jgi:hypothetical protein